MESPFGAKAPLIEGYYVFNRTGRKFVSAVGIDEETVREYIRNQDEENERLDQLRLKWEKDEDDEKK
jgi:hypothetical protein